MSRYAILSDVHANLEALEAVLAHLGRVNVQAIWYLGDLVNYGPDPGECIRMLLERQEIPVRGIRGNNDDAILSGNPVDSSRLVIDLVTYRGLVMDDQRRARIDSTSQSYLWTLETLTEEERAILARLENLDKSPLHADGAVLMHASPCDPIGREGNYLRTPADAEEAFVCDERFGIGFFGHTHHAGVFRQFTTTRLYDNVEHIAFSRFAGEMKTFPLDERRVLINPGSVGQPRDGDQRAAYAVYDTEGKIEFYRVEYPVRMTIDKLKALCDPERGGRTDKDRTSMVNVLVQRLQEAG